jgi:hypothetical protein
MDQELNQEPVTPAPPAVDQWMQLGVRLGRGQAFGLVANQCLAAQAETLRQIREEGLYKSLDMTWDEFCHDRLGISRSKADDVIRQLKEFGATYFRLAEIVKISSETYRRITPLIEENTIQIGARRVPIAAENAADIRQFVRYMHLAINRLEKQQYTTPSSFISLHSRLDACFDGLRRMINLTIDPGDNVTLRALCHYAINKLKALERDIRIPS